MRIALSDAACKVSQKIASGPDSDNDKDNKKPTKKTFPVTPKKTKDVMTLKYPLPSTQSSLASNKDDSSMLAAKRVMLPKWR